MISPGGVIRRAIFVTLCSVLCACGLVMDSSFDTLREALDSDMVNKGWIPGWVPQAATDLRRYMTSTRTPARWPSPNPCGITAAACGLPGNDIQ